MTPRSLPRVLITGGAGFIGSHLSSAIAKKGWEVTILDNLRTGSMSNIDERLLKTMSFVAGDCTKLSDVRQAVHEVGTVFHFAANPDARLEYNSLTNCFRQNVYATVVLLEAIKNLNVNLIVFASTSAVYGEAKVIPTPENYAPLVPISSYGKSKLIAEALITSHCRAYNKKSLILRFANVVGSHMRRGVVFDMIAKLRRNKDRLEILGDGRQMKSYLHIDDCIKAIMMATEAFNGTIEVMNVGSADKIAVTEIARIVVEESGLRDVDFVYKSGARGGRGWKGDVKNMLLDISKINQLGWHPQLGSKEAVRATAKSLLYERS